MTSRAAEMDRPGGRRLEAGDHPQHGGLAGAGRAEHGEELAVADLEVDRVDRDHVVRRAARLPKTLRSPTSRTAASAHRHLRWEPADARTLALSDRPRNGFRRFRPCLTAEIVAEAT